MKRLFFPAVIILSVVFAPLALARNEILNFSVEEAMASEKFAQEVGDSVKFYFGGQSHPAVEKKFGSFSSNKKTNAFNKSDMEACRWALYSALVSLRDRALREGGNAVVGIKSIYRNNTFESDTEFQCGAGAFVAGVALDGRVVKLKQ